MTLKLNSLSNDSTDDVSLKFSAKVNLASEKIKIIFFYFDDTNN